jgi:hypothetical protein
MKLFDKMAKAVTNDLKGTAKKFVIAALCAIIGGGVVCGVMLKTQIREAATAVQAEAVWDEQEKTVQHGAAASQSVGCENKAGQEQQGNIAANDNGNNAAAVQSGKDNTTAPDGEHVDEETGHERHDGAMAENGDDGGYNGHERRDEGLWHDFTFTEPSTGAKISVAVYGLLCCAFLAAYWLLTAAWLSGAASAAGMNAALWALAGFVGNIGAVVLFLILRSRKHKCAACGRYQDKAEFCRFCGARMGGRCKSCGAEVGVKDIYCGRCGSALSDGTNQE